MDFAGRRFQWDSLDSGGFTEQRSIGSVPRASSRKGKGPLWELARAGTQGLMMDASWHLVSFWSLLVFPLFLSLIYLCPLIFHMTFTAGWCITLFISSAYLATLLVQFSWFIMQILTEDTASSLVQCLCESQSHAAECQVPLLPERGTYTSCIVLYFAHALIPLFLYINQMYYLQDLRHKLIGWVFHRPDIVSNLHCGLTGWSLLGKTKYFPGLVSLHFFLDTLHLLQNIEKPGMWNI